MFLARLGVKWSSPIFSPHISSYPVGLLSSLGPLEEDSAHEILLPTLHSIAQMLVHGPFATIKKPIFGWHDMDSGVGRYFRGMTVKEGVEERCMRATAFFANAFNQSNRSNLAALDSLGLPVQSREISVMAIRELLEFYQISTQVAEKAKDGLSWDPEECYGAITTQREWMALDHQWATRIIELAKLGFLLEASKKQTDITEVRLPSSIPTFR